MNRSNSNSPLDVTRRRPGFWIVSPRAQTAARTAFCTVELIYDRHTCLQAYRICSRGHVIELANMPDALEFCRMRFVAPHAKPS